MNSFFSRIQDCSSILLSATRVVISASLLFGTGILVAQTIPAPGLTIGSANKASGCFSRTITAATGLLTCITDAHSCNDGEAKP